MSAQHLVHGSLHRIISARHIRNTLTFETLSRKPTTMFDRVNTHQFFRELFVPFDPVTFSVALIYDGASDVTFLRAHVGHLEFRRRCMQLHTSEVFCRVQQVNFSTKSDTTGAVVPAESEVERNDVTEFNTSPSSSSYATCEFFPPDLFSFLFSHRCVIT